MSAVTLGEHNRSNCQSHTHPHTHTHIGQRDKSYIYIYFYNIPSGGGIVRKVLCWRVEGHQELYTLECPVKSRPNTHTHTHTQQSGRFIRGGGGQHFYFFFSVKKERRFGSSFFSEPAGRVCDLPRPLSPAACMGNKQFLGWKNRGKTTCSWFMQLLQNDNI